MREKIRPEKEKMTNGDVKIIISKLACNDYNFLLRKYYSLKNK